MKALKSVILLFICATATGCTTTFAGSLFVVSIKDIMLYVFVALVLAIFLALKSERTQRTFWIWFALGIFFTPLTSLVALMLKVMRKS